MIVDVFRFQTDKIGMLVAKNVGSLEQRKSYIFFERSPFPNWSPCVTTLRSGNRIRYLWTDHVSPIWSVMYYTEHLAKGTPAVQHPLYEQCSASHRLNLGQDTRPDGSRVHTLTMDGGTSLTTPSIWEGRCGGWLSSQLHKMKHRGTVRRATRKIFPGSDRAFPWRRTRGGGGRHAKRRDLRQTCR